MNKQKISLVIPCYNEEDVLPIFYNEICKVANDMNTESFEFIFIDDGSIDGTLNLLKDFSSKDERVNYISFSRNFGKEAAMYAGLSNATGDWVAIMDADMQDPPSLLPEMYKYVISGEYDSVATRRVNREGEPPIRSFFARMFYKLINKISDADIVDGARDFRLMSRTMVDAIVDMEEYNRFTKGIFGWIGFKTKWLPYINVERAAGETKWSFWKLFKYSIEGIVNFSTFPLMISSIMGMIFCFFSALFIIFIIAKKIIFNTAIEGWSSLACIIMFIGGVLLLCIGIMGQYLAKTYLETKRRPKYIIREMTENNITHI